jgi:hypothetical protein
MPKKEQPPTIPQIGVKNVPTDIADKMQAIANIEGVSYNELYNLSFVKFIEMYENKNGKVKPRPKGKGLEGL